MTTLEYYVSQYELQEELFSYKYICYTGVDAEAFYFNVQGADE